MNIPQVGAYRTADHHYGCFYEDIGAHGPFLGVTSALRIYDKPAIAIWRGNLVAEIIAGNLPLFHRMIETGGVPAAVKWAGGLPNYQRDKAADTGSLVHVLVEKLLRRKAVEVPLELQPYALAFRRFLKDRGLKPDHIISVERMVLNLTAGYGGTFDFLMDLDGAKVLVDLKTWKRRPEPGGDMYSETGMQLAAYGRAEFTGIPGDPKRYAPPRAEAYAVLHLRPDLYDRGYQLYPFEATDAEYAAFLGLLAAAKWKEARSRKIIGEPTIERKEAIA